MTDLWTIKSRSFASCNCAANCGCQFNLPSTYGFCQFVAGGIIEDGHFNDTDLTGLNWCYMMIWPGEIVEGNGRKLIVLDERANDAQREAILKIVNGEAGAPGSNHFSVFGSTCSETLDPVTAQINLDVDIENRKASLTVPGMIDATGTPIINEFDGSAFHVALARPSGSFEFTYAEIGSGNASVKGPLEMELDGTYAQFNIHHYDQDGLVAA
jgi:hypothetical protein